MTVLGFCIIFIATTAGAALVFFFKGEMSGKLNTLFLGFASGVMVAASVWSLLIPSIEGAEGTYGSLSFLPAVIGFLLGGAFLVLIDKLVPHLQKGTNEEEGLKSRLNKPAKLFLAVTIHNIPEGLAVGFVFGAAAAVGEYAAFVSALALAVGMAIQNFPEGFCLAYPLNKHGFSKSRSFILSVLSGAVEIPCAMLGAVLFSGGGYMAFALAFAAGAMTAVTVTELIADAFGKRDSLTLFSFSVGFCVIMLLDLLFA